MGGKGYQIAGNQASKCMSRGECCVLTTVCGGRGVGRLGETSGWEGRGEREEQLS